MAGRGQSGLSGLRKDEGYLRKGWIQRACASLPPPLRAFGLGFFGVSPSLRPSFVLGTNISRDYAVSA